MFRDTSILLVWKWAAKISAQKRGEYFEINVFTISYFGVNSNKNKFPKLYALNEWKFILDLKNDHGWIYRLTAERQSSNTANFIILSFIVNYTSCTSEQRIALFISQHSPFPRLHLALTCIYLCVSFSQFIFNVNAFQIQLPVIFENE